MATPLMLMHYFPSGMLGLGLTAREKHPELAWYQQPLTFGVIVLAACVLLNILFW